MANKSLEQLDPASGITGAELIYMVQGGNARRASINDIAAVLAGLVNAQTHATPFKGALLKRNTNTGTITFPYMVQYEEAEYDTDGMFDPAFPTILTVPPGVTKVRLYAGVEFNTSATAHSIFINFRKNGGAFHGNATSNIRQGTSGFSDNVYGVFSPPVACVPGDEFEVRVNRSGSTNVNEVQASTSTYFALEVVEYTPPE